MKKTKSFWTLVPIMAVIMAATAGCSADEELTAAVEPQTADTPETINVRLNAGITRFDDEPSTRATDDGEWQDGDKIYLQFYNGSSRTYGIIAYNSSEDKWGLEVLDASIAHGEEAKCEAYYFDKVKAVNLTSLSLNPSTAIYADKDATYIVDNGELVISAELKPMTGRIRFHAKETGQRTLVTGLKYNGVYNLATNQFVTIIDKLDLTTEGNTLYTPYIYSTFVDESKRELTVNLTEEYNCTRTFGQNVLKPGTSGYVDMPTLQSRLGWTLVENIFEKPSFITLTIGSATFKMIKVEPGTFTMGSTDGYDNEKPTHQVTISKAYFIGQTEVTQALWKAVMDSNPSYFVGDKLPVERVSWNDCQTFITKLNAIDQVKATGLTFRLPTEAEWEFAARGGTKTMGYLYSGSSTIGSVAWYTDNSSNKTHEVATKQANELGLYDMSGNVYEWCNDWYGSYGSAAVTDPQGASAGTNRVCHGGSWYDLATYCRVAHRDYHTPTYTNDGLGLRLASQ